MVLETDRKRKQKEHFLFDSELILIYISFSVRSPSDTRTCLNVTSTFNFAFWPFNLYLRHFGLFVCLFPSLLTFF